MTTPRTIGPYRVERLLGTGGFATVWLAHDPGLDAWIAIKVLADNWSHDLRVRERFVEEGRLLRRLDDERVVRVHAVGALDDGRPYLVMAWADRGSLTDRLAAGPLPADQALALLREVARGVAVLHRQRIVHRDLTPGNVLLRSRPDGSEQVLIGDLGLAKALATASGLTIGVGTSHYAAPEQRSAVGVVDERADVYALAMLGRTLLGALPRPAPLPGVDDLLVRAGSPDPDRRPVDASAFLADLERLGDPSSSGATRTPAPQRKDRHRRWLAGAATLLAVGAATAAWQLATDPSGRATVGPLVVDLPDGWSAAGTGWAGRRAADGAAEPAVVVGPHPARWADDPTVPGAFVGYSESLAADGAAPQDVVAARRHGACSAPAPRTWRRTGGDWSVVTFSASCERDRVYVEAAARRGAGLVYVQVAVPVADADTVEELTAELLDGLGTG